MRSTADLGTRFEDPLLPAKKRPIFDLEAGYVRAFDRSAPLKKRVPEHLLQDPVHVVSF